MTGGQENRREVGRETRGDYGAGAGASAHVPAVIQRGIPFFNKPGEICKLSETR